MWYDYPVLVCDYHQLHSIFECYYHQKHPISVHHYHQEQNEKREQAEKCSIDAERKSFTFLPVRQ